MPIKKEEEQVSFIRQFWDGFYETEVEDEDESPHVVRLSRAIKILVVLYLIIKPIILIVLSQTPPKPQLLQSVIILAVIGLISNIMAFAGAHFRIMNLSVLYCGMDVIIVAAEMAVLISICMALPTSAFQGLLAFYISLFAINLVIIALSLTLFVILYRKEVADEEKAEEEKKRLEEEEELAKKEAAKKIRHQRRAQRKVDRELRGAEAMYAAPTIPVSHSVTSPAVISTHTSEIAPAVADVAQPALLVSTQPIPTAVHAATDDL